MKTASARGHSIRNGSYWRNSAQRQFASRLTQRLYWRTILLDVPPLPRDPLINHDTVPPARYRAHAPAARNLTDENFSMRRAVCARSIGCALGALDAAPSPRCAHGNGVAYALGPILARRNPARCWCCARNCPASPPRMNTAIGRTTRRTRRQHRRLPPSRSPQAKIDRPD